MFSLWKWVMQNSSVYQPFTRRNVYAHISVSNFSALSALQFFPGAHLPYKITQISYSSQYKLTWHENGSKGQYSCSAQVHYSLQQSLNQQNCLPCLLSSPPSLQQKYENLLDPARWILGDTRNLSDCLMQAVSIAAGWMCVKSRWHMVEELLYCSIWSVTLSASVSQVSLEIKRVITYSLN